MRSSSLFQTQLRDYSAVSPFDLVSHIFSRTMTSSVWIQVSSRLSYQTIFNVRDQRPRKGSTLPE